MSEVNVKDIREFEEANEAGETETKKTTAFEDVKNKTVDKAKEGLQYIYDNPGKTLAAIGSAWAAYKTVIRPIMRDVSEYKHACSYYDRYGSQHTYELKRKMTNNEMYECDEYVRAGGNAYEWLKRHRLARR
jgi:hypothetical protein